MTHAAKYRQNKRLLQGYVEYLEHCTTYEQRLKLSTEIGRLQSQNEAIKQMSVQDYEQQAHDYQIVMNSGL